MYVLNGKIQMGATVDVLWPCVLGELSLSLSGLQFTSRRVCTTAEVPQGEDPHVRKDPQTMTYRGRLGMNSHPLREREGANKQIRVGVDRTIVAG